MADEVTRNAAIQAMAQQLGDAYDDPELQGVVCEGVDRVLALFAHRDAEVEAGVMAKKREDTTGQAAEERPVVKRERAEIYSVIGQLERAKGRRQKLAKRLASFEKLEEDIKLADEEIAGLSKKATELMAGELVATADAIERSEAGKAGA